MYMEKIKECISDEEAENIIEAYTEGYISDSFGEKEARSMAIADLIYEYDEKERF